jgi:hypothetical protein
MDIIIHPILMRARPLHIFIRDLPIHQEPGPSGVRAGDQALDLEEDGDEDSAGEEDLEWAGAEVSDADGSMLHTDIHGEKISIIKSKSRR